MKTFSCVIYPFLTLLFNFENFTWGVCLKNRRHKPAIVGSFLDNKGIIVSCIINASVEKFYKVLSMVPYHSLFVRRNKCISPGDQCIASHLMISTQLARWKWKGDQHRGVWPTYSSPRRKISQRHNGAFATHDFLSDVSFTEVSWEKRKNGFDLSLYSQLEDYF